MNHAFQHTTRRVPLALAALALTAGAALGSTTAIGEAAPAHAATAAVNCGGLRTELALLQGELGTAPANQKARIIAEIREVEAEIREYC